MKQGTHLRDAEALGEIKTLPELPKSTALEKELEGVINDPEEFRIALGRAQMDQLEYIEVTPKLFDYLRKNQETRYICYGSPGIKVYKVGTRDECEKVDKMNAENYQSYVWKKENPNWRKDILEVKD